MSVSKNYHIEMKEIFNLEKKTVAQVRAMLAAQVKQAEFPQDTVVEKTSIAHLAAEWVSTTNALAEDERTILYFHGGGFFCCSCDSHRNLAAAISAASGVRVLLVEYRLAPEHQYPAANNDALAVYHWLLASGIAPENIVIGGDSCGGGLTLMTLLSLREAGEPLPAAAFMLSPWADLIYFDGESYTSRAAIDPVLTFATMQIAARHYLGSAKVKPLILSPLNQDLSRLPPLLIQVGDHEILLSDSIRLAEQAKKAGVDVTLEIWDNMGHVFQQFAAIVPEAEQAVDNIGKFIKKYYLKSKTELGRRGKEG